MTGNDQRYGILSVRGAYCARSFWIAHSGRQFSVTDGLAMRDVEQFFPYALLERGSLRRKRKRELGAIAVKVFADLLDRRLGGFFVPLRLVTFSSQFFQ